MDIREFEEDSHSETEECSRREKWLKAIARDEGMADYYLYKYLDLLKVVDSDKYKELLRRY